MSSLINNAMSGLNAAQAALNTASSRKAPKIYRIQSNCEISQLPVKIMMVRRTIAPSTPYTSTRRCNAAGTDLFVMPIR